MNRLIAGAVMAAAAAGLSGCGKKEATKDNFKSAIQAYLDTTPALCVALPGEEAPFKVASGHFGGDRTVARAAALTEAGLLTSRSIEIPSGVAGRTSAGFEYDLTEQGRKYYVKREGVFATGAALCGGKYKVTEVVNFTEPSEMGGTKVSRANYRYVVEDAAAWARLPAVVAAYPQLKKEAQGIDIPNLAVLVATNEGWMHERLFRKGP